MAFMTRAAEASPLRAASLYRAVWRWHFYAGLLVLPFLAWLAVTGGAYLFQREIDGWYHRDLLRVPVAAPAGAGLPHGAVVAAALAAQPGQWFRYTPAEAPGESASVGIATAGGERVAVYVDPATARVLGQLPERGTLAWQIRRLHSLKVIGPVARGLIEMAAGWAVVLVATGLYLWWPRGRRGGVVTVRGRPSERVFWRDLHAVLGLGVGLVLAFLAVTGLPWSVFLGAQVNAWANGSHWGYPSGVRVQVPMSAVPVADTLAVPWSLQQARVPAAGAAQAPADGHEGHGAGHGGGHDGHEGHGPSPAATAAPAQAQAQAMPSSPATAGTRPPLDLDAAMAAFGRLGLAPGFSVAAPQGPGGVYTASAYPSALEGQRVVHLDQYTGRPLIDMGYADYGPVAKGLEWGINVHLGQQYGVANQIVLAVACAGIVLLSVAGAVAWWKRRPAGGLGVPPLPAQPRALWWVVAIIAAAGVAMPLLGLSLLCMLALDALGQGAA
ncbi:PepSY-associated TM helix domain-containing protein [Acidovorax sp. NCPPB 4044]|uniref:PepSY-associated TM helix domain-containing protein n=1 Tax=Acidovorax sp. NCPPB 4044 TaxID=2940490 RepID=UPI002304604A|nr:PepSY domain-containing protein [Acidovorax sp. NCPPB 4044]MDA8523719.1 PepSY domain-containing protein [Acidovorax sp. NCPPB 4044]